MVTTIIQQPDMKVCWTNSTKFEPWLCPVNSQEWVAHPQPLKAQGPLQGARHRLSGIALVRLDRYPGRFVDHTHVPILVKDTGTPVRGLRHWVALGIWVDAHPLPLQSTARRLRQRKADAHRARGLRDYRGRALEA
jgi:hypothetical protein